MVGKILCKRCGSNNEPAVGPGTAVHIGRLVCADCGSFFTWIKKKEAYLHDIPARIVKADNQRRLF